MKKFLQINWKMKGKKILIEVLHPAHVHLFRNFIRYLKENKIEFVVVSREKDITNKLLDYYQIPYLNLSKAQKGILKLLWEALTRDWRFFKLQLKHKFDVAFTTGTSFSAAHVSFFTKLKTHNFIEDDDDVVGLYCKVTYPFTDYIVIPDCLRYEGFESKRVIYPSYHELAYLHPNHFTPDEKILEKYGLEKGKFVIFRLVSLTAHHDVGAKGISDELRKKMQALLGNYHIVESFEGKAGNKVDPWDMHHLLAFAKMIISDSQTMTVEAAVLGVPAIRVNTFIGRCTVLDELEQRFKLAYGFFPHQENEVLEALQSLIQNPDLENEWAEKRKALLNEKIDFSEWMIKYFEKAV